MSDMDGLVGLDAAAWGALLGAGIGIASLVYLLTAHPGGWTELVKALTILLNYSLAAVPVGWVLAWIVGLPHPWLVAVAGAAWYAVAYVLADGLSPDRMTPWVHCTLCILGYGLVAGLVDGGDSTGSWPAAIARVIGGVVVLGAIIGLVGRFLERPLERLVVTRDLRRLGFPLLVPDVPDHRLHAGSVELTPLTRLSLYYATGSEDSRVRVDVHHLPEPFPPTEGPWIAVHGPDYWDPDGDDRWIHHTDQPTYIPRSDGTRPRYVKTELAVRRGEILIVFTNDPRTIADQALRAAADSLRPMEAGALAGLVGTWFD